MNLQTIDQLRDRKYSAPPLKIEKVFFEKEKYTAHLASYISDGLKIYGFLTIPKGEKKEYPVVIFNKGYLPLDSYAIDRQYVRYIDYLAKKGFIVFKSDYRGYGDSEGREETIFEGGFAIDVLNAIEALKKGVKLSDNNLIEFTDLFIWGHSLGGDVALKVLEVNSEIKAASIWAAPTASYDTLIKRWQERPDKKALADKLITILGDPNKNQEKYWQYSPSKNLEFIDCPIQLIHGTQDDRVPLSDSIDLKKELERLGKKVELVEVKSGDHNLTEDLNYAMEQTIKLFEKEL